MQDARPWRHLYDTSKWKRLRTYKLSYEPLCERCKEQEIVEIATTVHHRKTHKGDEALFFDLDNLESLCKPHHDSDGKLEDMGKDVVRYGADGWPI